METIIISDIHLGADNCQTELLLEFLDSIQGVKRLILNGDVFQDFDSKLSEKVWEIIHAIRRISSNSEVVWVKGNHDSHNIGYIIAELIGASYVEEYSFVSGDKKILCIHGDSFDTFLTDHPILTWLSDVIYWLLQKVDKSFYLAKLVKHNSKTFLHCAEKIKSGALGHKGEHDMVICGHTHMAMVEDRYCNSGTWTELPPDYLLINDGCVELKSYIHGRLYG